MTDSPTDAPPAVPTELRAYPQWVAWNLERRDDDRPDKVPYAPATGKCASVTDPATWGSLEEALALARRRGLSGVGFVVTAADPFAGVDLDGCRDPDTGAVAAWAMDIVRELDSYAEVSPSGAGLRVWVRGRLPPGRRRAGGVEMYDRARYFTVTGRHLPGTPAAVEERGERLGALHRRLFGEARPGEGAGPAPLPSLEGVDPAAALERARAALPPAGRLDLWRLLHDPERQLARFGGDRSRLDLAAAAMLARAGLGVAEIAAVWRHAPLGQRRKVQGRDDYVARTIGRAREPAPAGAARPGPRLLWDDEVEALPPPEWLVEGLLVRESIAALYGPSGAGKSFLAIDLALCVATGRDWHGRAAARGPAVYVAAEGSAGLGGRLRAWKGHHGHAGRAGLLVVPEPVNLLDGAQVDALLGALAALAEPPLLVVLDTLAWAMVGGDENSTRDMMAAVEAVRRLRAALGATVLLVHHTNKAGEAERGNSALRGAADTMLKLTAGRGALELSVDKQKDAAAAPPAGFRLLAAGDSCVPELLADGPAAGGPSASGRRALAALAEGFLEEGASATAWLRASGLAEATFYRARTELVRAGLVERRGRLYAATGRAGGGEVFEVP